MLTNRADCFTWTVEIVCTFVSDNIMMPNVYTVSIGMQPNSPDTNDVELGFKKIKHFVNEYLSNSVFVNKDSEYAKALSKLDTNLVLFPDEPYDYLVAAILYRKLEAISEKYFDIDFITIDSTIGDRIQYTLTQDCVVENDLTGDWWWNKDSVNTGTDDHTSWEDLDLKDSPRFSPIVVKGGKSES
jgi:hypothetical protein